MHHTSHSLSLLPLTHSLRSSLHRSSAVQRCEIHKGNLPPSRPGLHQPHIMPFLSCALASLNSLVPQPSKPSPSPAPPRPQTPFALCSAFLPCFPWFFPPELLGLAGCQGHPKVKRSLDGGLGRVRDPR